MLTCHSARQQQARCRVFRACRACAEAHTAGRGGGRRLCMEGVEGGARTRPNRARHGFAVPWGGAVRVSSKPLSTKMARGRGPDRTVGAPIHTAVRALACPATRALPLAGHASRFRPAAAARPGLDCAPAACHGLGETPDLPQRKSRNPARPGMQERSLRLGTALHQWSNFGLGVSGVLHRGPSLQKSPARRGCSEGHTRWLARHEARHRCLRRA